MGWDEVGVGNQTRRSQTLTNGPERVPGAWDRAVKEQPVGQGVGLSLALFLCVYLSLGKGRKWWLESKEGLAKGEYKRTSERG